MSSHSEDGCFSICSATAECYKSLKRTNAASNHGMHVRVVLAPYDDASACTVRGKPPRLQPVVGSVIVHTQLVTLLTTASQGCNPKCTWAAEYPAATPVVTVVTHLSQHCGLSAYTTQLWRADLMLKHSQLLQEVKPYHRASSSASSSATYKQTNIAHEPSAFHCCLPLRFTLMAREDCS